MTCVYRERGIRSLYQEFELTDPEAIVRPLLDAGAMRSHRIGALVIAIGNEGYWQAKVVEKGNQETSRSLQAERQKEEARRVKPTLETLELLKLGRCSASRRRKYVKYSSTPQSLDMKHSKILEILNERGSTFNAFDKYLFITDKPC